MDDLISRQAAIDALCSICGVVNLFMINNTIAITTDVNNKLYIILSLFLLFIFCGYII